MNCALFPKIDQVFSFKKKHFKNTGKNGEDTGKVRQFCQSGKVGMKGSPCCAGLMRSCLHTYRTKTNLTQHIIQPWGGRHQTSMGRGGHQPTMGGASAKYGGAISQVWGGSSAKYGGPSVKYGGHQSSMGGSSTNYGGGHQPSMGGHQSSMGGHQPSMGGPSVKYGGVINQLWGGPSAKYGGGYLFFHQYVQEVKIHRITLATHTSCLL